MLDIRNKDIPNKVFMNDYFNQNDNVITRIMDGMMAFGSLHMSIRMSIQ